MIANTVTALKDSFKKRYDASNSDHLALINVMNPIAEAATALEVLAANTDPEQSLESHDLKLGRAGKKLKEALELAQDKLDRLKANAGLAFDSGLKEHSGLKYGPFASEIRGMVRLMGPGERAKFIQGLILASDGESLAACLLAPAFLSGFLSEGEKEKFSQQFFKLSVPKIVAAQELYDDLADHVQGVFRTAQTAITKFGQPSKYNRVEQRQAENLNAQNRLERTVGGTFI